MYVGSWNSYKFQNQIFFVLWSVWSKSYRYCMRLCINQIKTLLPNFLKVIELYLDLCYGCGEKYFRSNKILLEEKIRWFLAPPKYLHRCALCTILFEIHYYLWLFINLAPVKLKSVSRYWLCSNSHANCYANFIHSFIICTTRALFIHSFSEHQHNKI